MTPTLIACSHGTRSPSGQVAIRALIDQVRTLLPHVRVLEAFVDVQEPAVADVVADAVAEGPVVVVPVLLSTGFHTKVDIAEAVAPYGDRAVAAAPLGPHDLLALTLESRLEEVRLAADDSLILAAAGSTDPAAADAVRIVAGRLANCLHRPVTVAFAAGAQPRIGDAVAAARADGAERVVVASYVLAPGYFADVVSGAGADVVTAPLAPDVRVAGVIAERYSEAVARLAAPSAA